jgi:hypothetical protein
MKVLIEPDAELSFQRERKEDHPKAARTPLALPPLRPLSRHGIIWDAPGSTPRRARRPKIRRQVRPHRQ